MFIFLAACSLLICGAKTSMAQDYNTAVSLNMGGAMGVSLKQFLSERSAIEVGFDYNLGCKAPMFTGTYQYHIPLAPQFCTYVGAGVNIGAVHVGKHHNSEFAFGLDPNVGFEYKFASAPVALALDYKPWLNFTTHCQVNNVALRVRFTL